MELTVQKDLIVQNSLEKEQNKFLNTILGKVINTGIDVGLRAVLPDFLENEVISVKNAIFENGLKSGLDTAISSAINLGKSALGIFSGSFEDINQIQIAVGKGGILDSVSDLIDISAKKAKENGTIENSTFTLIKNGKNTIIKAIESNIENSLENQIKSINKVSEYTEKWNDCFEAKDIEGMTKSYNNMKRYLKDVVPIETTLKEARTVENLHTLIKNKGSFELTEDEIDLAQKLVI